MPTGILRHLGVLLAAISLGLAAPTPTQATPYADHPFEWPQGASLVAESRDGAHIDLYLDLPSAFLNGDRPDQDRGAQFDEIWLGRLIEETLRDRAADGVRSVTAWASLAQDPNRFDDPDAGLASDLWVPLIALLPDITPPAPREPAVLLSTRALVTPGAPGASPGALSGKVIYISAGHGFYWSTNLGRWATQRGNTHGMVEDLISAEAIDHLLIQTLRNAGAQVFALREEDTNPQRVVVDAEPGGATSIEGDGTYNEGGTAAFSDSTASGFRAGTGPLMGEANPFALGGTRVAPTVTGEATAWARWTPHIPESGWYKVLIGYAASANRSADAHFVVHHPGGQTDFRVNQQRHGSTWITLGSWYFEAGESPDFGSVTLFNDSEDGGGTFISADVVRFGGGMGGIARGDGQGVANSPTSNRPRFEECGRYFAQSSGAPPSVWDVSTDDHKDDVAARPRFAAWQNEAGEDAIYMAWHTNAPDPGRGTSTWVYGPNAPNGQYNFTGVAGSDALAEAVHGELLDDIRALIDPSWNDRGLYSAWFGELNPNHNPEMPAVLVEVAFHDTAADAQHLRNPIFRHTAARAMAQGAIRYFAARDDIPAVFAPNAPVAVFATALDETRIRVRWAAPAVDAGGDAATRYRVYRSRDGRSWNEGAAVTGLEYIAEGEALGEAAFFRVAAVNSGGISFPSATVGAATGCAGAPRTLVVHGQYRLDGSTLPVEDLSAYSLGELSRYDPHRLHQFNTIVAHGQSLTAAGVAFDGAEATAIASKSLGLEPYSAAIWAMGNESTIDETFSGAEQLLLATWLNTGDRTLVVSGSELLWDLDQKGTPSDRTWAHQWLGAAYATDSADTDGAQVNSVGTDPLGALPPIPFGAEAGGPYAVAYPDVLTPLPGAEAWLDYDNGSGAAAVWFAPGTHRALTFGFPLDAIAGADVRDALISGIADALGLPVTPSVCASTPPDAEPSDISDAGEPTDAGEPSESDGTTGPDAVDADGLDSDGGPNPVADAVGRSRIQWTFVSKERLEDSGCAGGPAPINASIPWVLTLFGLAARRIRRTLRQRFGADGRTTR